MHRLLLALVFAMFCWLAGATLVHAQEAEKPAKPPPPTFDENWQPPIKIDATNWRGPGWYVAVWKIVLILLPFWLWVRTTDWVSRDCVKLGMNYDQWNSIVFFPFVLSLVLVLLIPVFFGGYPLIFLAYVLPLVFYVRARNAIVAEADKVMTKAHIRYLVANAGNLLGAKIDAEKKLGHEKGPPVNLLALGAANEQMNQANVIEARQSPAFITLKELIADAATRRVERILLDYTAASVGMKFMIDGVWLDQPPKDRASMDPVMAVMKKLANLNPEDRKKKQEGAFGAEFQGTKYMCPLVSQGTQTGERAIVTLAGKAQKFTSLLELGMREKMLAQFKEILVSSKGIVVLCAPPQGGLSQSLAMSLKATDRLLRDFIAVGDPSKHEPDVENVELTPFNPAKGETPVTVLPKLILREPDVLVIRELNDAGTLKILIEQCKVEHTKLSITTVRAKDAVEAVLRVAMLKVPPAEFAPYLLAVLNTRLIRRLCDQCKEGFEPSADFLAKLGIPAGRVQQLYRERQPLPPDSKEKRQPCTQCRDIGYFGRTAIFELLIVNDKFREALVKQPQMEVLKKVAKATGHRTLQEEGIALLALGVTSLAELQRVLKQ